MAYSKTVWKARQGTNLNKFTKSQETSGSVILTNTPDSVTEPGTPFSAENMNHIEEGIAEAHKAIINYSTVEQDTGRKWIDGRSIYQITFIGINPQIGSPIILANLELVDVWGMYSLIDYTNARETINCNNGIRFLRVYRNGGSNVVVDAISGADIPGGTFWVTCQYVK